MIEINLAPGAARRRAAPRFGSVRLPKLPALGGEPHALVLGAVALVTLLTLGYLVWSTGARRAELEARVTQEVADSTRFATTIGLLNEVRARQDTIRQKIGIIREVDQRRYVWPHLLDEISLALPAYTWLTQIQTTAPTDSLDVGPAFAIQGNAGSTQALTRFMKNLESSPFIRDVTLVTSEQDVVEGRTIQRFALEASYREPDPSQIERVPLVVLE